MITDLNKDFELDMLKGNINRMCVTDDEDELYRMFKYGQSRLNELYRYKLRQLKEK